MRAFYMLIEGVPYICTLVGIGKTPCNFEIKWESNRTNRESRMHMIMRYVIGNNGKRTCAVSNFVESHRFCLFFDNRRRTSGLLVPSKEFFSDNWTPRVCSPSEFCVSSWNKFASVSVFQSPSLLRFTGFEGHNSRYSSQDFLSRKRSLFHRTFCLSVHKEDDHDWDH
jgi:hypothetical protein